MIRLRTGYSFRTAVGMLDECMQRLITCGYKTAPITDRASTFGYCRWKKLADKNKLRPVFGVELGVTRADTLHERKNSVDYWTFLATDEIASVNRLVYLATEQFYYEPIISYQQAAEAKGLIKVTGHRADLTQFNPQDDLFISLSPSSTKGYIRNALAAGHKLAACSDNKYPTLNDRVLYETICGRETELQTYDQFIQTEAQWRQSVSRSATPEQVNLAHTNSKTILSLCNATLKQSELLTPEKPQTLRQMCEDGAKRIGCDLTDPVYAARLDRELSLIAEKKFEDYFYILADICQWSRKRMLLGPARGSSAGSLVCYLLEITTVDPIPYKLIFERFIDLTRKDLPDVDIDFSDQQREKVFQYMADKYGKERVARIGSVALYKGPSALNEAGAALRIPKWKCDAVAESLLKRSTGDARALDALADTLDMMAAGKELLRDHPEMVIATKMEGHPRHSSQHAAGIVLTKEPALNYVAIDARNGTMHCDKKDADDLNLLKIDALGLTQLSTFEYALELAGLDRLALESIDMDDPAVYKLINDGKFCGIFQFNGMAVQSIVKQYKVTSLDDIVSATALSRPGPLASGNAHEWVRRKNGVHQVEYPHPIFEPYLKSTFGIVLYQEQVMEIGRHVGDLSWEDVTALRKSMSKSLGVEYFNQFGDKWKPNAVKKGLSPELAEKFWSQMCQFGSWGYNLSHAVSYGIISYQSAWLKAHYPFEFAAATLTNERDPDRQIQMLREMVQEGYEYIPIDVQRSTDKWTVGDVDGKRVLLGPFSNIKGIGDKTITKIIAARSNGGKLPANVVKLVNASTNRLGSLFPVGDGFKRLLPDPKKIGIFTKPTHIKDIVVKQKDYEVTLFCILAKINPRDENEAVNVARRGGKVIVGEPTASLNLQLRDDTDTVFGKISRWDYDRLGKPIVDRGRVGKCLYVMHGKVKGGADMGFRMVKIDDVKYIGELVEEKPAPIVIDEPKEEQLMIF